MEAMDRIVTHLLAVILSVALSVASAAMAVAQPALWEVKGPHATVYRFGSVHVLNKDKPWRTAKTDAAIGQSGSLWLEIPNTDDEAAMQELVKKCGMDAAEAFVDRFQLKAADAQQLAAAYIWSLRRPLGRVFLSGDLQLLEAARLLGFHAIAT